MFMKCRLLSFYESSSGSLEASRRLILYPEITFQLMWTLGEKRKVFWAKAYSQTNYAPTTFLEKHNR